MFIDEGLHEIKIDLLNKTFKKIIKRTNYLERVVKLRVEYLLTLKFMDKDLKANTNLRVIFTALKWNRHVYN